MFSLFIENCSPQDFNFSDRFTAESTLPSISAHSQHYTWNEGESVMTIAILAHDSAKSWRCSSAQLTAASYPATQSLPPAPPVGCWRRPPACPYTATSPGSWAASSRSRPGCLRRSRPRALLPRPAQGRDGSGSEQNLLRLCDMHSVPISTNIATAEVLLRGLDQATLTTARASIPTSWSRCPSIGPCAKPVFKTFSAICGFVYRGFSTKKDTAEAFTLLRCLFILCA